MEKIKIIYDEYLEQFVVASEEKDCVVNLESTDNIGHDLTDDEKKYYGQMFDQVDSMNKKSLGDLIMEGVINIEIDRPKNNRVIAYDVSHLEDEVFLVFDSLMCSLENITNSFFDLKFKHQEHSGNEFIRDTIAKVENRSYDDVFDDNHITDYIGELGEDYSVLIDDKKRDQIIKMKEVLNNVKAINNVLEDIKDSNDFIDQFTVDTGEPIEPKKIDKSPIEV